MERSWLGRQAGTSTTYQQCLVNTLAHSNSAAHDISWRKSGNASGGYAWWHYNAGGKDLDYNLATAPDIPGVACFNMSGCETSSNATGSKPYTAYVDDIATRLCNVRKAGNSIAYKVQVHSSAENDGNFAQEWFNNLYTYGLDANANSGNVVAACQAAEHHYLDALNAWGLKGRCSNPLSSPNWGWDEWVVTYHGKPMLDY